MKNRGIRSPDPGNREFTSPSLNFLQSYLEKKKGGGGGEFRGLSSALEANLQIWHGVIVWLRLEENYSPAPPLFLFKQRNDELNWGRHRWSHSAPLL